MSKALGRVVSLGIAKETVRGTAETAATFYIPWSEASVEEKDTKIADEQSYGIIEDSTGMSIVKQWAEATVKAPIGDKHFPLILFSALGALSTAANADASGTVKDHTITVAQTAQHQALTLFLDDPASGADYKHALGCLNSLEIKFELGKFLDYQATFKAKKGATATLTPSVVAENRFLPQHLTFKTAANLAGLTAASAIQIRNLSLKIEKNLEEDDALGSIGPVDFLNKQISIEGQLEAVWSDETFKTLALAGTIKAMRLDLNNLDVTIGTAAHPQIVLDLAKVTFKELTRPFKLNDIITQQLSFKASYSSGDTKMVTIKATNLQASY